MGSRRSMPLLMELVWCGSNDAVGVRGGVSTTKACDQASINIAHSLNAFYYVNNSTNH